MRNRLWSLITGVVGTFTDVVLAHLAVEGSGLESQDGGGAIGAVDLAARTLQSVQDGAAFQRRQTAHAGRAGLRRGQPGRVDDERVSGRDDHGPLDDVLQL